MRVLLIISIYFAILLTMANPAKAEEKILQVDGPQGPLQGTLLKSGDNQRSAVIIIPGSGPTDRDGNSPNGLNTNMYRHLGQDLQKSGMGSLRIDKRGFFGSSNAIHDPNAVKLSDYAEDVVKWVRLLKDESQIDCVWLLGHSEGGLVAMLSTQFSEEICGLILVASPGRVLSETLKRQLRANPANEPLLEDAFTAISTLESGKQLDVKDMHPALQQLFHPNVQDFIIDLMRHDPGEMISKIRVPVLILQGGKDIQIPAEDAELLHSRNMNTKLVLLPEVNHVLKKVTSQSRAANLATYTDPTLPVDAGVVEAIVDFVKTSRE